jgi:hypothetical protein
VKQKRKALTGFNPKTQQKIRIPANTVLKFRVAKVAKETGSRSKKVAKMLDTVGRFGLLLLVFPERLRSDSSWLNMEVISPVQRSTALNRGMFFKDCLFLSGEPSVETPERNR